MLLKRSGLGLMVVALVLVATVAGCNGPKQQEAGYPNGPIEFVVPFPPGGVTDITARAIATSLHEKIGQPAVVINKAGASGMEGGEYVAHGPADGYHVLLGSLPFYLPEQHRDNPSYKSSDLRAVCAVYATTPALVVSASAPWKTAQEFVDWAKAQGTVSIGHTGKGTSTHQTAMALGRACGFKVTDVPFKGDAPAAAAVLGNNIQVAVANFPALVPHLEAGTLRVLFVVADSRMAKAPDVPTVTEAGFNLPIPFPAAGFFVPKDTPDDVVIKLDEAIKAALDHPTTKALLEKSDVLVYYRDHTTFQKTIDDEKGPLGQLMKDLGIITGN